MSETCLLTGCAGFIGSHLAERLLRDGHTVIGVDCFTDQYSRVQKLANLADLKGQPNFEFVEGDLNKLELLSLMDGVTAVVHLAGQVGARNAWGRDFAMFSQRNALATQLLLEASLHVDRFVYASNASVYGDTEVLPTPETATPRPISPYAASKMTGEHLCTCYAACSRVPTAALRLASVYGPRQRPDQAVSKFVRWAIEDRPLDVYGDGEQTRDLVYVGDVVEAFVAALAGRGRGEVYNIGSGTPITVNALVDKLRAATAIEFRVKHSDPQRGDVRHAAPDITRARDALGFAPRTSLEEGLAEQVRWMREVASVP